MGWLRDMTGRGEAQIETRPLSPMDRYLDPDILERVHSGGIGVVSEKKFLAYKMAMRQRRDAAIAKYGPPPQL